MVYFLLPERRLSLKKTHHKHCHTNSINALVATFIVKYADVGRLIIKLNLKQKYHINNAAMNKVDPMAILQLGAETLKFLQMILYTTAHNAVSSHKQ